MKISKIIHNGQTRIKVDFPYNQEITAIIKQINDARWSQNLKAWHIPDEKHSFYQLKSLFPKIKFEDELDTDIQTSDKPTQANTLTFENE